MPPLPPAPDLPHRVTCVEATPRLRGSLTGCVADTQGLLLLDDTTVGAVQQPQLLLLLYNNITAAAQQARNRLENIKSGTNRVGKAPNELKLCEDRAMYLRIPPARLDC